MSSIDDSFEGADDPVRRAKPVDLKKIGQRWYMIEDGAMLSVSYFRMDRLVAEAAQEIIDAHNSGGLVSQATYGSVAAALEATVGTEYGTKFMTLVQQAGVVGIEAVAVESEAVDTDYVRSEDSASIPPYMLSAEEFSAAEKTPFPEKMVRSSPRLKRAPSNGRIETRVGDGYSSTAVTKPTPVPGRVSGDGASSTYRGPNPLDTPPPQPVDDHEGIYMLPESDYVMEEEVRDADGDAGSCIRKNPLSSHYKGCIPHDTVPDLAPRPVEVYTSAGSTAPEIPSARTAYNKQ